jgi:hypothetical protein
LLIAVWPKVKEHWRVWLVVAWTFVVVGLLIFAEVSTAEEPDDGFVSNGSLEVFAFILAVTVWMIGFFLGVFLVFIASLLVDRTQGAGSPGLAGSRRKPDWR